MSRATLQVRRAVKAVNVNKKKQQLIIKDVNVMTGSNAKCIADFLQQHPDAVNELDISCLSWSRDAVEILCAFFANTIKPTTTTLEKLVLMGNLGNFYCAWLLSGYLHHGNSNNNTTLTTLVLRNVGLEGAGGGMLLAVLLLSNQQLTTFSCEGSFLGLEGARALQRPLRGSMMNHHHHQSSLLHTLALKGSRLGDDGIALVVNALQENNTVKKVCLDDNDISSNGLPNLTRLLLQHPSVEYIILDSNIHMFDNQENTRLFFSNLSQTSILKLLSLNYCQLPGHVIAALFRAVANNATLEALYVYDTVQLQGTTSLEPVLEAIPEMLHLFALHINLDFVHAESSVLSAFHWNTSFQCMYSGENETEIINGPVFGILARNRRLYWANNLLNHEPQRVIPLGLWAKGMEQLTRDATGATAMYRILRNKLPSCWWASKTWSMGNDDAAAAAAAAAAAVVVATTTKSKN